MRDHHAINNFASTFLPTVAQIRSHNTQRSCHRVELAVASLPTRVTSDCCTRVRQLMVIVRKLSKSMQCVVFAFAPHNCGQGSHTPWTRYPHVRFSQKCLHAGIQCDTKTLDTLRILVCVSLIRQIMDHGPNTSDIESLPANKFMWLTCPLASPIVSYIVRHI